MLRSYFGIASRRGLELFVPEGQRVPTAWARFARRADAACYWLIVTEEDARRVDNCLSGGDPEAALHLLDRSVAHAGPILPSDLARTGH